MTDSADERAERAVGRPPRRRWLPVAAAAATVAVVATTSIAGWQRAEDGPGPEPRQEPTSSAGPADGGDGALRQVAWRGVAVEVPASWGDAVAPGGDWCAFDGGARTPFPTEPYVARDTTYLAVLSIGCPADSDAPAAFGDVPVRYWAPHVWFSAAEPGSSDTTTTYGGWTLSSRTVEGVRVGILVDATTADLAEQVLSSAHPVATDGNGCDSTSPVQATRFVRPDPAFDIAALDTVDAISVCKYDRSGATTRPGLLGSRRLTGAAADDLLAAIQEAPPGGGPDRPESCLSDRYGDTGIALRMHDGDTSHDMYVYYDWCFGNGFDDGTTRRELTLAACLPLWGGRVQLDGGSSEPFRRCHE